MMKIILSAILFVININIFHAYDLKLTENEEGALSSGINETSVAETEENTEEIYNPYFPYTEMDALVREFPDVFCIKWWTEVSKTYEMPKKYVHIGKLRELSLAQRENLEKIRDVRAIHWE